MKLALNYSQQAEKLLADQKINIDLFKCPEFDDDLIVNAQRHRPVYIHFPLNAGRNSLKSFDWRHFEALYKQTSTPYINLHLIAFTKDFPGFSADTTDEIHTAKVVNRFLEDVNEVIGHFGADKVIVENVIYRGGEGNFLRPCVEPSVITRVVEETGCGLLLDTAHAQMTAKYLGVNVFDYVSRFPLDSLREMHVTGIQHDGNRYRDSMPMTEEDWELAEWAITNIRKGNWPEPWAVALEYGGVGPAFEWRTDMKKLEQQVPRLYELVHSN